MLVRILRRERRVVLRESAVRDFRGRIIERQYVVAVGVWMSYNGTDLDAATAAFERAAAESRRVLLS